MFGGLEWSYKVDLLAGQLIGQSGTPVVSIAQDNAETPGCEFWSDVGSSLVALRRSAEQESEGGAGWDAGRLLSRERMAGEGGYILNAKVARALSF